MKKTKIAVITSLIIVTIVASLVTIFLKIGKDTQTIEASLQESKHLSTQSTITYEEVQAGDSDVYYTDGDSQVKIDNFELDAYFIENGQNVRGVTRYLDENPNLNIIVNASQFVNLTIKNMKITVSNAGIDPTITTSTGIDGIINSINGRTISFNDFYGGSNSTINISIKEGLNTTILTTDLSTENTVTFTGTCVYEDESGNTQSYNFEKIVDFTVDWTGEAEIYSQTIRNYSDDIIGTDDKIILNLAVNTMQFDGDARRLINKQADYIFSDLAVNGVKPSDVKVTCTSADQSAVYNYDKENDILTYTHVLTQGYIPYGYNSIITITYPRSELEAALNNEIVTKQYTIQGKISAIGNKNISYNNNAVYGILETDYVESTVNIDFRDFTGSIIDFTNRLDSVKKASTRIAYSKSEIEESYYDEVWHIKVALDNYYETLEVERNYTYNENKDSAAFFDGTNNVYYSMDDCKYYRGFNIPADMIDLLGGEDNAIIEVYSVDDSGNETKITNIQHGTGTNATIVDYVTQSGQYYYKDENGDDISYKNIKFVIRTESDTDTIGIGDYWITHYMKVDNTKVTSTYDINTFESFTQVHTSTKISGDSIDTDSVEYIMPATASADYIDGNIFYWATDEIKLDVINENFIQYDLMLHTADKYYLQYIENPTLILELPEEFTDVDNINLEGILDTKGIFTVDSYDILKQNGKIIIKTKLNGELMKEQTHILFKMYLNVPEDEISTSMPDADVRIFIYSDILDGLNITPFNNIGRQVGKEADIYDIDGDGDTSELQCTATTDVLYLTPSGMSTTTTVRAEVDGETLEETCPNVLEVVPNKTNTATVDVNLYLFYLETTVKDLKIVGRIPYVDNTYVLDSTQDLGSTFSTTMTSAGITVPDDIKNYTTVYYSTTDATITKGTATTVDTSIWKTKDQVTDWSQIKSYLIVIDDAITNDSSMYISTFSYDINLPTNQTFGEKSYATHAVEYVSKVGDSDEILMQTETNKVGISFVTDTPINVTFTKTEEDKTTGVSGAKYELSNFVDGEPIGLDSEGSLIYTKTSESNPNFSFSDLYTGIKYELTETEAPSGYEKHDSIIFEIKMNSSGEYYIDVDSQNSPSGVIYLDNQTCTINSSSISISGAVVVDEKSNAEYIVKYYYENIDKTYSEKTERPAVTREGKIGTTVSVLDSDKNPQYDEYEYVSTNSYHVLEGTVTADSSLELKVYFNLKEANYRVEYYYEDSNGNYVQRDDRTADTRTGTIGYNVSVTTDDKNPKFDEYEFETNNSKNVLSGTVAQDNSLVLKVYFNLKDKGYTVEYYYQNDDGTYSQRSDRKASDRTGKIYETVSVTTDDKDPLFDNYQFESTNANNVLSDTLELNKTTTLKVYFRLINKQYTVEYYYQNDKGGYTQRTDREPSERTGTIGQVVYATDSDKDPLFNNYEYESTNTNNVLSDTLEVAKTTTLKVYFKYKIAEYKVEYYYENIGGTYTQRSDRSARTDEGIVGEEVSVTDNDKAPLFNNYEYESTNTNNVLTGTILEGNGLVLKVYFKFKKANYTVEYYYEQDDGSFKQINDRPSQERTGTVDDTASVTNDDKDAKHISYEFDSTNTNNVLTGTIVEGDGLVLKVYFKFNKANYKVEYYYQNEDGTYSQRSDRQAVTREGIVGREVSVTNADKDSGFTYYVFEDTHEDNKLSGTVLDNNGLVLKVYFKLKKANYTVRYYYEQEDGSYKERDDRAVQTRSGTIDHEVTVTDDDKSTKLSYYVFESDNSNNILSGTVLEDNSLELRVYFKYKKANYRVQYYYENRDGTYSQRDDRQEETRVGIVDFSVNVTDDDKDSKQNNYEFESDNTNNKLTGIVLENNGLVLKVYFKFKIADYKVEYYYENKDGSYNKISTRPDVTRSGIAYDTVEVTTEDKDPKNEIYTFASEYSGNILTGTIAEDDSLVLKVHFRLKKITYNLDLNKQKTNGETLTGTKFSVYLDNATIPMFDLSEVTSNVELPNQVLYMGSYDLWITENSTAGDPYINILDGKYIRIRMNSTTDEKFEVVGTNNNGNDDFFEVYESDKVTKVTDENILKWIDVIVDSATNTLTVTVKNPIQYNVNITTVDTLNTFVQGNAYSVYRNETLLCTESVTTDIERNENTMGAGTYDYYFTQNNLKDRYINILNGRFVKVSVTVSGDGKLSINGTPQLFDGTVGDANAKEVTAEEITKYFSVTVNNETAISSLELNVIYPVTFNVEVDKMKTDNEPLENTEIKISSPIINDQNYVYDNEQISGIDSITEDGTITGTTDYVIDDGTQARVSYAETYVHANANGYYTYEITEVTPAGGQYVNILEGYKVVLRIKVSGNGDLTLVDENGNAYAENETKRFTIVATGDKEVTEDLYDYVYIGIDNNTVRAVLNAEVINPIRYKMAVHQSLYGTDGRVQVVDMPVKVNDSDLTNRTIEKSPVWATEKVEYKVTQDNPLVDNGLINILDGYYIGVDINIPGDGDIKTIASNGDKTTNSYRIYKADGTEVNFNETHIDDFVRVQITKDNNNVCTVNIYVEVPQEYNVKLLKIDADTKEALNDVEFSMVAKYEGNEIKLKDITKNSDQIFTQYLKTANVDGEDGIIKLNNILIEKAGKYTFVLTETTPDPKPEYTYKDKNGNIIVEFEVTEGDGRYVITNITTNNVDYSEGTIGENNLVELTVKNERITGVYSVEITKISELLGLPLQGSEFKVRAYKKNADGEDEDVTFYNNVIKTDDTQVVPGTFDINSEDGINNYEIMIENTDKHFLEITEIKAPDTYTKLAEPIVLKVTPKLVGEYDDAKYVIDSIEFISGDNEGLVTLTGYEDEKIKLEVKNNQFDLALRQYVSSINGEDVTRWNTPEVDTSKLVTGEATTAEYYNNKTALRIFAGQEVIYTFRVYNEGQIDGYANEIVAYLPEQLEFLENDEFNTSRNWVVDKDNESVKDKNYMTAIKTDYLSKAQSEDNLIKAFDHENNEISYVEVQVKCKIKDDEDPRQTVTTLAEITKFEAPTRPDAIDRDSNESLEIPEEDELPEYKYKTENENGYTPGDEDDDDFEKLHIEKFDLATEKFVTSINNEEVKDTEPSFEVDEDGNHINYKETNDDLKIADGNIVEYTIRAYNQGTIDAYASIIEEELPKELIFDKNNPINIEYGWKMLDENRNETDDVTKAKYLTTDYLSKVSGENRMTESDSENPNLIKEFDEETMEMPDYRDVKVILIANLPTEKEGKVVNIARVKSGTDSEDITLKDEETENDDSDETLNIVYFDLSISKWITETVTYQNGKETVDSTGYEADKDDYPIVKIDIKKSKIDEVAVKIKYNIKVTNEGSVPGYAKEITDYIPDGLKFDPADNPTWTLQGNNAVTTELEDKLLAPGETATVSIVLTWINLEENVGLKVNVAEITKDYNEQGDTKDIDSVPANKNFEEDDLSDTTKLLISVKTGEEQRYTLIIIAIGAIIGVGIVAIKKYVIK